MASFEAFNLNQVSEFRSADWLRRNPNRPQQVRPSIFNHEVTVINPPHPRSTKPCKASNYRYPEAQTSYRTQSQRQSQPTPIRPIIDLDQFLELESPSVTKKRSLGCKPLIPRPSTDLSPKVLKPSSACLVVPKPPRTPRGCNC